MEFDVEPEERAGQQKQVKTLEIMKATDDAKKRVDRSSRGI